MRLTLIRHGESIGNVANICQGQTHGELSAKGILQAQATAELLLRAGCDSCFTSDLNRAFQTAAIIASKQNLPTIKDIRLRERYFGKFQGQTMPSSWDGLTEHENSETIAAITQRVTDFIREISSNYIGKEVFVISHGITIRLLVAICLKCNSYPELPDNCSISQLERTKSNGFELVKYNDVSHLKQIIHMV